MKKRNYFMSEKKQSRLRRTYMPEFKQQLIKLCKENKQLKMENDILKQATLIKSKCNQGKCLQIVQEMH